MRRPEKSRRIIFYPVGTKKDAKNALVKDVGKKTGTKQFLCTLRFDNSDELIVDFSEKEFTWEYEKFPCNKCDNTFETKRSLSMHTSKVHKEKKTVAFTSTESALFTEDKKPARCKDCERSFETNEALKGHIQTNHKADDSKAVRRKQVRFQEIMSERDKNDEWIKNHNQVDHEAIFYAEIKETA